MNRASLLCLVGTVAISVSGCGQFWPFDIPAYTKTGAASLKKFGSEAEFKQYLAEQVRAREHDRSGGFFGGFMFTGMPSASPAPTVDSQNGPGEGGGKSDDYSTTNLQEAGVDESDVMKNDGRYLYLLSDDLLRIADVQDANAVAPRGTLALEGSPDSLYLRGDNLIAISRTGGWYAYPSVDVRTTGVSKLDDSTTKAIVSLVDAADKDAPAVVKTYRFEGDLVSSRMIDGKLHLVLAYRPTLPPWAEIPNTPIEQMLPKCETVGGGAAKSEPDLIAGWQDFYRPADGDGYGMVTVITIDTTDPNAETHSVGVTADAGLIYASTEALYLTDTEWGYTADRQEATIVHKFDFGATGAEYKASGSVPGRPLNQFSLGEHEGYLRIATTIGRIWQGGGTATNNVFVLGEGDEGLEVVGEIRNIAPGEEIYSARFMGPRGFLVTFVKVDPFFTLDLSDPTNPQVVGELKVPGYSDYMHILDENHILSIGKDAEVVDDFTWYQGLQLSIFDVTDFADPQLLHREILGGRGTESQALHDHRAFNFFAPKDLLAIPVNLVEGGSGGPTMGKPTFTGIYVYRVTTDNGFELQGRISTVTDQAGQPAWYSYYNTWARGVFIGDHVFAVTDELVRSAGLDDVGTVIDTLEFGE